jgi:CheY-like chemotaxis protein
MIHDDPALVRLVTTVVRRDRGTVTATRDAIGGLELARDLKPDVLLCDAEMPKLSGAEVIELLKSHSATAQIPVVLMSGSSDAHVFAHVQWAGFLGKPFTGEELLSALRNAAAVAAAPIAENAPAATD